MLKALEFKKIGDTYLTLQDFYLDLNALECSFIDCKTDLLEVVGGILFIPSSTPWNGSNVVKDVPECMAASLVHDILCDYINNLEGEKRLLRELADCIYVETCIAYGMSTIRAKIRGLGLTINRVINF